MEAHTPKRQAVEKFIASNREHAPGWEIRVVDQQEAPVVLLEAVPQNQGATDHGKAHHQTKLEIHTRQVSLIHDDVDNTTKQMIQRWMDSLVSGETAKPQ